MTAGTKKTRKPSRNYQIYAGSDPGSLLKGRDTPKEKIGGDRYLNIIGKRNFGQIKN
jgi:hypothetical protein